MLSDLHIKNNENLITNILKFNNVRDLSILCQVNKMFKRSSDSQQVHWREEMNNRFSSDYEHYNLVDNIYISKDPNNYDDKTNWKALMKKAFEIKQSWIINNDEYTVLKDIENVKEEFYSSLQVFIGLPKLRKINRYVENDLNSTLQQYFLDQFFESQELYDYYDNCFNNEKKSATKIEVRRKDLPFAKYLEKYNKESKKISSNIDIVYKIRWYQFEELLNTVIDRDNILSIIISIIKGVHIFCRFSDAYIKKFKLNDIAMLNEYSKRYRHFIDVAIHLNNLCENINVLVNYIYEDQNNVRHQPKFSILRLFLKIWHKEVLFNLEKHDGLINKITDIFKNYINKKFMELGSLDCNEEEKHCFLSSEMELIIEQFNQHLLDMSCNEFNVFYLNSSEYILDDSYYKNWEEGVLSILDETVLNHSNGEEIHNFLKNNKMINSFIYRTKMRIIQKIINIELNNNSFDVMNQFKIFASKKNMLTIHDAEIHFKLFGDSVEKSDEETFHLFVNSSKGQEDTTSEKYKAILFINYCNKSENASYITLKYLISLVEAINKEIELNDHIIAFENKRRNIFQGKSCLNEQLHSITDDGKITELYKEDMKKQTSLTEILKNKQLNYKFTKYSKTLIREGRLMCYRSINSI